MMPLLLLLALSSGAGSSTPSSVAGPTWEKVFDGTAADGWVSSVHAAGRDTWFAGGKWGVVWAGKGGLQRHETGGRGVLGLFAETADSVFALGQDELILHFDGKTWTEEHRGPKPRRSGRGADLLHSAYRDATPEAPLVAFGPWLVLVRQQDGRWTLPPEKERKRLSLRGDLGPEIKRPPKCDAAGWRWIGKNKGAFFCHDRRVFIFDSGAVTAKGVMPRQCETTIDSLVFARGEIYTSCASGTLWKTDGPNWQRVTPPKGVKEIPSLSVTDDCIFVAGGRAVWRSCEH